MFGAEFFYSGYDPDRARALIEEVGFRVDRWGVDDASSRGHVAGCLARPE